MNRRSEPALSLWPKWTSGAHGRRVRRNCDGCCLLLVLFVVMFNGGTYTLWIMALNDASFNEIYSVWGGNYK